MRTSGYEVHLTYKRTVLSRGKETAAVWWTWDVGSSTRRHSLLPAVTDASWCFSVAGDSYHGDSYSPYCFDSFDKDEKTELALEQKMIKMLSEAPGHGSRCSIQYAFRYTLYTYSVFTNRSNYADKNLDNWRWISLQEVLIQWPGNRSQETAVRFPFCSPLH